MIGLITKVVARFVGQPGPVGSARALAGLRRRDGRELATGLLLLGLAYLARNQRQQRELVYRKVIHEGEALVIRASEEGDAPLDRATLRSLKRR
ncbi:MAG: hypothetical protein DIU67_007350 [Actinomycetes bacterium]|jgi:hypothetical protein|nr:MAG: hypothetical protein DIU67_02935 [Actinomycetota bacterium]